MNEQTTTRRTTATATTTRTTRFSGADWSDQLRTIYLIGLGGIGSYVAYNLARIGHQLILIDGDVVDETNVNGGQLYRVADVGKYKVDVMQEICRQFGGINGISAYSTNYEEEDFGANDITICGLDNMAARKQVFEAWVDGFYGDKDALYIDGRLLMESMEIFAIKGDDEEAISKYREEHLFDDSEVADLDCTSKQSSFAGMIIAGMMTAILCNYLTNRKMGMNFRTVPFYQRLHLPIFKHDVIESTIEKEALV